MMGKDANPQTLMKLRREKDSLRRLTYVENLNRQRESSAEVIACKELGGLCPR